MDLEEWEFLPRDGFIDVDGDSYQVKVFDGDYFISHSAEPPRTLRRIIPNQLVQVPISWEPIDDKPEIKEPEPGTLESDDQETVSTHVCFKKREENEFADIKLESPKYKNRNTSKNEFSDMKLDPSCFDFDGEKEGTDMDVKPDDSPRKARGQSGLRSMKGKDDDDDLDLDMGEGVNGGLNIFRWGMTGIGALCSFGIAVATTFLVIFSGTNQKNKKPQQPQNNLRFQIYTDDKRIQKVVQHATRLNEAIGVPISRAHISYGGYYDGL